MFSKGQLIFAAFFVTAFVTLMIFSYKKDFENHKIHYRGSVKILIAFISLYLQCKSDHWKCNAAYIYKDESPHKNGNSEKTLYFFLTIEVTIMCCIEEDIVFTSS